MIRIASIFFAWALLISVGVFVLPTQTEAHGPGGKGSAPYEAYEKGNIPPSFKGRKNPLDASEKNIEGGKAIYQKSCVMCHGAKADGKGHMAEMMTVKPGDLRQMLRHFPKVDDYYFWIISQGGNQFNIPMPGFGESLSATEIWQVVTWMQVGFPGAEGGIEDKMHHDADKPGDHMMKNGEHMRNMPIHR